MLYTFHSIIRCRPGLADAYQARACDPAQGIAEAKGFRRRILLRSVEDTDCFFHISSWEKEDDAHAFRDCEASVKWRAGRDMQAFTAQMERTRADIVSDSLSRENPRGQPDRGDTVFIHSVLRLPGADSADQEARLLARVSAARTNKIVLRSQVDSDIFFEIHASSSPDGVEDLGAMASSLHTSCRLLIDERVI